MTPVSSRYAVPLLALLLMALAPMLIQRTNPRRIDSCTMPEALRATSLIPDAQARGERLEKRSDDVIQWSEGEISVETKPGQRQQPDISYAAVTNEQVMDAIDWAFANNIQILTHANGEAASDLLLAAVEDAPEPEQHFVRRVETAAGTIPIHVVIDKTGRRGRVVAYLFVYDVQPFFIVDGATY